MNAMICKKRRRHKSLFFTFSVSLSFPLKFLILSLVLRFMHSLPPTFSESWTQKGEKNPTGYVRICNLNKEAGLRYYKLMEQSGKYYITLYKMGFLKFFFRVPVWMFRLFCFVWWGNCVSVPMNHFCSKT